MRELARDPVFGAAIAAELVAQLTGQGDLLVALGCKSAAERVAQLLWDIYVRLEARGRASDYSYDFPLGLQEVAEVAGITPVHATRTDQALRGSGLIDLKIRRVRLLDVHRLFRFCSLRAERPRGSTEDAVRSEPSKWQVFIPMPPGTRRSQAAPSSVRSNSDGLGLYVARASATKGPIDHFSNAGIRERDCNETHRYRRHPHSCG